MERVKNNRWDVLCCIKGKPKKRTNETGPINLCFANCYTRCMLSKSAVYTILAIAVLLIALAVPAYMNLELGLENQLSTTKGSDLYKYFIDMEKYLGAGPPAYVILNNFQYYAGGNGIDKTLEVLKS